MNWEHLADGVEVCRFWKAVPTEGKEPQMAVLRLSSEKYGDLYKTPKDFINGFKVFDKQVNSVTMTPAVAPKMAAQSTDTTPQIVVVIHRPTCAAFAAAALDMAVAKAA